jgi:drug/metabolite transporter (DMT)-like permease
MQANMRGILLLTLSMAAFAAEDALIKLASDDLPTGQILLMIGVVGAPVFAIWGRLQGHRIWSRQVLDGTLWLRNLCEVIGTLGFVTALTLISLSTASAILQAAPIVVTAGAAIFLGETVGWRRWTAIAVGFLGVLVILRPTGAGFDANALWAVLGVLGLASRDLVTRKMRASLPTMVVATWAFVTVAVLGAAMLSTSGGASLPNGPSLWYVLAAVTIGIGAYWCIIEATRAGDVATIQPFRYTRLIFAMIIGALVFDERPDVWTLFGAAIIIGAGLYTFARERARQRALSTQARAW